MKKNASFTIVVFLLAGLFFSCNKDNNLTADTEGKLKGTLTDLEYVKYGTSFGMCGGYCQKSISIKSDKVDFEAKSWVDEVNYPTVNLSKAITATDWADLVEEIDFNAFQQYPEYIGCPDCADGGAEWIEIKKGDEVHKATYEFSNEPQDLTELVNELKILFDSFEE